MELQRKRPCVVSLEINTIDNFIGPGQVIYKDKIPAIFHRRGTELVTIKTKGKLKTYERTIAIVEFENGLILNVESNKLKFTDK